MSRADGRSDLREQLLAAAVACTNGSLDQEFTFEDLLVAAWRMNPAAWGLRGYERDYPDSERLHREVDSRGTEGSGLVGQCFLQKTKPRVYRLTQKGLAQACEAPTSDEFRQKADRALQEEIERIINHPAFRSWLKDNDQPRHFRQAGSFWRIAMGTPPTVMKSRILAVDAALDSALAALDQAGQDTLMDGRGNPLFTREDVLRSREFNDEMKRRFSGDLKMLGVVL